MARTGWLPAVVLHCRMRFHGLLDHQIAEVVHFYLSGAAEAERVEILEDEPEWGEMLEVVLVDFSRAEVEVLNV